VHVDPVRALVLRRFFPAEEGGTDTQKRENNARINLVPLQTPVVGKTYNVFLKLPEQMRADGHALLMSPFMALYLLPHYPRDEFLRGRHTNAVELLTAKLDEAKGLQEQVKDIKELETAVVDSCKASITAAARLMQRQNEPPNKRDFQAIQEAQEEYD